MVDLSKPVQYIRGVGPAKAGLLNKLGIFTLEDLITHFPRNHEDRSKPKEIAELVDGQEALIDVIVTAKMSNIRIKSKTMQKLIVRDETGTCTLTWFNQPYLKDKFKVGEKYKFFGKIQNKFGKVDMLNPV